MVNVYWIDIVSISYYDSRKGKSKYFFIGSRKSSRSYSSGPDLKHGPTELGRDPQVNERAQCVLATFGKLHL